MVLAPVIVPVKYKPVTFTAEAVVLVDTSELIILPLTVLPAALVLALAIPIIALPVPVAVLCVALARLLILLFVIPPLTLAVVDAIIDTHHLR